MEFGEDFGERALQANANADVMAEELADIVRSIMRAAVANSDNRSQTYLATKKLDYFLELFARADSVDLHELVENTVADLTIELPENSVDEPLLRAASAGVRYLIEKSCSDPAAKGRASKRQREFEHAAERIQEDRRQMFATRTVGRRRRHSEKSTP